MAHSTRRARSVKRSKLGACWPSSSRSAIGPENRLCTACLLTPRAALIWDQDSAAAAAAVHEVAEQGVGGGLELADGGGGGGQLVQRILAGGVLAHGVDEILKAGWWRHASTIS